MSEEAELLREMVADREHRIKLIQLKTEEQLQKEERLHRELGQVQELTVDQKIGRQTEKTTLLHARQTAQQRLEAMQRDLQQQGSSLSAYTGVIKQEQMADSSYVMRMQAQLCKGMHSMGIIDHQMELAQTHADILIKSQKDAVAHQTEENSQMVLELMNQLMKIDTERRDLEAGFKARMDVILRDLEHVRQDIEKNQDSDDDEGADSEEEKEESDDEEEKEAKKELMALLTERKNEIEKLEQVTEQQLDTILEFKEAMGDDDAAERRRVLAEEREEREEEDEEEAESDEEEEEDEPDEDFPDGQPQVVEVVDKPQQDESQQEATDDDNSEVEESEESQVEKEASDAELDDIPLAADEIGAPQAADDNVPEPDEGDAPEVDAPMPDESETPEENDVGDESQGQATGDMLEADESETPEVDAPEPDESETLKEDDTPEKATDDALEPDESDAPAEDESRAPEVNTSDAADDTASQQKEKVADESEGAPEETTESVEEDFGDALEERTSDDVDKANVKEEEGGKFADAPQEISDIEDDKISEEQQ